MEKEEKQEVKNIHVRKGVTHCRSLYHEWWFRVILIIVSIDMIVFGFAYAIGINFFEFLPEPSIFVRALIGFLYVLSALAILHYVFEYERMKEGITYICYKCVPDLPKGEEK